MKMRPQFNLKLRDAEQFYLINGEAAREDISMNEYILRGIEWFYVVLKGQRIAAERAEGNNAEIATGGSAGVAAAGISPEGECGVQKGAAGYHGKLLRGQSVSGAAAAEAGVGGAVRDAEFQAGDGKFIEAGKCPHGYIRVLVCPKCNGKAGE